MFATVASVHDFEASRLLRGLVDVGADGVARFDRSGMIRRVTGASRRRHVLTLWSSDVGLQAYVFTFGH